MADESEIEFTGTTKTIRADPPRTRPVAPVAAVEMAVAPLAAQEDQPVKAGSHPKHSIVRERKAWEAAMIATQTARAELISATDDLRLCEKAEGNSLADYLLLCRPITPFENTRAHIANQQKILAEKAAGRNAPVAASSVGHSEIDRVAAARGRHAGGNAQKAGTPLRSNQVRR